MSLMDPHFQVKLKETVFGHILVWPFRSRIGRRRVRGKVISEAVSSYYDRYVPFIKTLAPVSASSDGQSSVKDRLFSIWLQGERQAPDIVKACWRSVRANCSEELVILDGNTLFDWVSLPDFVVDKWRNGKMGNAHFADICRLDLLCRHGGIWLDATDFVPHPIPDWIKSSDFFVFMSGDTIRSQYSFVQNCFIRAEQGNFLVSGWRDLAVEYWRNECKVVDYYMHQLLFRKFVENNDEAARQFALMPKLEQDPTHTVWYGYADKPFNAGIWQQLTSAVPFQKTDYKSSPAYHPVPGSFADVMLNMYK